LDIQQKGKGKVLTHELLFVMYFWGFPLLQPILQRNLDYSTWILFTYTAIIMSISISILLYTPLVVRSYIFVLGVFFVLLLDLLFRSNGYTTIYIYEFIIYGIIPVHLFSQVKDAKKLLKIFSYVSLFAFLIFFTDPLNGYAVFGDYMAFGFNFALPAYFGLYVGRKFFKYRWMIPFEVICFIDIVIYANRSTILSIILLWIIIELFYIKGSLKQRINLVMAFLFSVLLFVFLQDIISFVNMLLNRFGLYSFSLLRIQSAFSQGDWNSLFAGRLDIWELAKNMVSENILFGSGTGSFQARYNVYSHNLYYDIIIQYGLIGLLVLIGLVFNAFLKVFKQEEYTKLLGLILFCTWFPKLFFSLYIFRDIGIWCFLAFGFLHFNKKYMTSSFK
jgi:O-antigen ligase